MRNFFLRFRLNLDKFYKFYESKFSFQLIFNKFVIFFDSLTSFTIFFPYFTISSVSSLSDIFTIIYMTFINLNIDNHETEVNRLLMTAKSVNENFLRVAENFILIQKSLSIQSAR